MKKLFLTPLLVLSFAAHAMLQEVDPIEVANACNLVEAAKTGNFEAVKDLLDQGVSANAHRWTTALQEAASNSHLTIVQLLLERGALVNQADPSGVTALHKAANRGHQAIVQLLLDRGASTNLADAIGKTAFYWACKQQPCCELLVNRMMKIPNDAQRTKIYNTLICLKRLGLSKDLRQHMKPFFKAIIEAENRDNREGSVAFKHIKMIGTADKFGMTIGDPALKDKLIAKFWPPKLA